LSEIEAVMRLYCIEHPDDKEEWLYLLTRLDVELVGIHQEEQEKKAAAEKAKASRPPRVR
jgi:hypothetical protein